MLTSLLLLLLLGLHFLWSSLWLHLSCYLCTTQQWQCHKGWSFSCRRDVVRITNAKLKNFWETSIFRHAIKLLQTFHQHNGMLIVHQHIIYYFNELFQRNTYIWKLLSPMLFQNTPLFITASNLLYLLKNLCLHVSMLSVYNTPTLQYLRSIFFLHQRHGQNQKCLQLEIAVQVGYSDSLTSENN